jgi:hypothetical protein
MRAQSAGPTPRIRHRHATENFSTARTHSRSLAPTYPITNVQIKPTRKSKHTDTAAAMADEGLDRANEERMEFTTSSEVSVAPTCVSLTPLSETQANMRQLRADAPEGYAPSIITFHMNNKSSQTYREPSARHLRLRL